MTLVITGRNSWKASPYNKKARKAKLSGVDIQALHTTSNHNLTCKCGHEGQVIIHKQKDSWAWGECPHCHRPYLISIV